MTRTKEIWGSREAAEELRTLQLFGGGDIISVLDSRVEHSRAEATFGISLMLEPADGTLHEYLQAARVRGCEMATIKCVSGGPLRSSHRHGVEMVHILR